MHGLQVQDAARSQALQAVCCSACILLRRSCSCRLCSFELGGEKKTKGAALQFVSIPYRTLAFTSPMLIACAVIVSASLSRYSYPHYRYLPSAHYVVCTLHAYATTHVTKLYSYGSEWSPWTTSDFLCDRSDGMKCILEMRRVCYRVHNARMQRGNIAVTERHASNK